MAGQLDEIFVEQSKRLHDDPLWYPYRPQNSAPRLCPDHPDAGIVQTRGRYAFECPACHTLVCQGCGTTENMAWFSSLCGRCQDRKAVRDREMRWQQRQVERDRMLRLERLVVALEQDGAELRRLLRFLHRPDPNHVGLEFRVASERQFTPCWSGCGLWPCATRRILDEIPGEEPTADQVREDVAGMPEGWSMGDPDPYEDDHKTDWRELKDPEAS